jgi:hypothetical protein
MKKKSLFGINFDPKMQPGHQGRTASIQSLQGVTVRDKQAPELDIFGEANLRQKFGSRQVAQTLPSRIFRPKGKV